MMPLTLNGPAVAPILKTETAEAHQRAEAALNPKLEALSNYEEYAALLRMFYGFYHPLEQLVATRLPASELPDMHRRLKAGALERDLEAIGFPTTGLPLCQQLPPTDTIPQCLGVLYVLEGSTLGGRYISNMLMRHPGLKLEAGQLHFFNVYGKETGSLWKSLLEALERHPAEVPELVASASETFHLFQNWIEQNLYDETRQPS